jgi:K+-transporting ATPase ATPase B chain
MDRLVQRNVLAMSGRAVEAAGDVTTLLLDKTGTITFGNRQAAEFLPVGGGVDEELAEAAHASSWPTRPPRAARSSTSQLAENNFEAHAELEADAVLVPFTAQTRMSGVDLPTAARCARAPPTRCALGAEPGRPRCPEELDAVGRDLQVRAARPLVVADGATCRVRSA